MPKQNRVNPYGELIIASARGLFMGNRGVALHNDRQEIIAPFTKNPRWIICLLEFKGRRRPIMQPGLYTELFFLDEATALAAGHRPCFECQRSRANAFRDAWLAAHGSPRADGRLLATDMDSVLQEQRLTGAANIRDKRKRTYEAVLGALPAGTFVIWAGAPHLWWGGRLYGWTAAGYRVPITVPAPESVAVLTPPATVGVLRHGYVPVVHETVPATG